MSNHRNARAKARYAAILRSRRATSRSFISSRWRSFRTWLANSESTSGWSSSGMPDGGLSSIELMPMIEKPCYWGSWFFSALALKYFRKLSFVIPTNLTPGLFSLAFDHGEDGS